MKFDDFSLTSKEGDKITFSLKFNFHQFNELIYCISQSVIPSLSLKNKESEFLSFLIENEIENFVELTNLVKFNVFVNQTSYKNASCKMFCLFNYYIDVIFIVYKLKKFCNKTLLPNNLLPLLDF